ncbi:hypothetical protein [Cellulosimicrobium sp. Marseille-Q4280]|uniref:hypothetical protein n=1 Tax=Cellulosimicrobium sp. Marseille-Q4280 TaxID=2937992 RepID=UPI002040C50C|nr:hypothetical protein [Cellulosimicrobium sp. Marseille-Q4280]
MDAIETGQGRVPASASAPRVPAGVRAGGQFRTAERQESPVALTSDPVAGELRIDAQRGAVAEVPDGAAALPALGDGVIWD